MLGDSVLGLVPVAPAVCKQLPKYPALTAYEIITNQPPKRLSLVAGEKIVTRLQRRYINIPIADPAQIMSRLRPINQTSPRQVGGFESGSC